MVKRICSLVLICLLCSGSAFALTKEEEQKVKETMNYYCNDKTDFFNDYNCVQAMQLKTQSDIYKQLIILNNKVKVKK